MSQLVALHPTTPVRQLALFALVAAALLLVAYLVLLDQGDVSRSGMLLHELAHDGRHLLGAPCH